MAKQAARCKFADVHRCQSEQAKSLQELQKELDWFVSAKKQQTGWSYAP